METQSINILCTRMNQYTFPMIVSHIANGTSVDFVWKIRHNFQISQCNGYWVLSNRAGIEKLKHQTKKNIQNRRNTSDSVFFKPSDLEENPTCTVKIYFLYFRSLPALQDMRYQHSKMKWSHLPDSAGLQTGFLSHSLPSLHSNQSLQLCHTCLFSCLQRYNYTFVCPSVSVLEE